MEWLGVLWPQEPSEPDMMSRRARPDLRGAGRDGVDGGKSASSDGLPPVVRKLRCAVYTRKSTEEGLDMEFNSLDAQREACEAYIVSQRAEGWSPVRDRYDDGGVSGGTLERTLPLSDCWQMSKLAE